jgi:hypothetical protein
MAPTSRRTPCPGLGDGRAGVAHEVADQPVAQGLDLQQFGSRRSPRRPVRLGVETQRAVVEVGRAHPRQAVVEDAGLGMDDDHLFRRTSPDRRRGSGHRCRRPATARSSLERARSMVSWSNQLGSGRWRSAPLPARSARPVGLGDRLGHQGRGEILVLDVDDVELAPQRPRRSGQRRISSTSRAVLPGRLGPLRWPRRCRCKCAGTWSGQGSPPASGGGGRTSPVALRQRSRAISPRAWAAWPSTIIIISWRGVVAVLVRHDPAQVASRWPGVSQRSTAMSPPPQKASAVVDDQHLLVMTGPERDMVVQAEVHRRVVEPLARLVRERTPGWR